MRKHLASDNTKFSRIVLNLFMAALFGMLLYPPMAKGGTYLSTDHGNSVSGVDRSAVTLSLYPEAISPYPKGHCGHCHEMHGSIGGVEPSPTGDAENSFNLFKENFGATYRNELCYACHETFNFGKGLGYGRYGIYQGKIKFNASIHFTSASVVWSPDPVPPGPPYNDSGNCHNCHNPHGYNDGSGVIPDMLFKRIDKDANDYTSGTLCDACHNGTQAPKNVMTLFSKTRKHPTYTIFGKHSDSENRETFNSGALSGTNRHAECVDCHNPHTAKSTSPLEGSWGVTVNNASLVFADLTTSNYTYAVNGAIAVTQPNGTSINLDYKICLGCHSNWAYGAEANAPIPTPSATWRQTNIAKEVNANNRSYHYVEGDLTGTTLTSTSGAGCNNTGPAASATPRASTTHGNFNTTYVGVMEPTLASLTDTQRRSAKLRCSSCHGMDGKTSFTPEGPHGSARDFILKVPSGSPYTTWNSSVSYQNSSGTIWCFNCHSNNFTNTGFSGNNGNLHTSKHNGRACQYCHVAIPHGWKRHRLLRFDDCDTAPYAGITSGGLHSPTSSGFTWQSSGSWTESNCHNNGLVGSCG